MTAAKATYYKAFILLVAFSLNTMVSFACSLSNLFHNFHHNNPAKIVRGNGAHTPGETHQHSHGTAHSHEKADLPAEKQHEAENDCCSNTVVEMQQSDKSISRSIDAPLVFFATSFLTTYYSEAFFSAEQKPVFRAATRWRPPATIQDLRIAIQSFQI